MQSREKKEKHSTGSDRRKTNILKLTIPDLIKFNAPTE